MCGGHTHTAEETAPGGPTRLGWQDEHDMAEGGQLLLAGRGVTLACPCGCAR